ncbi:MAG: hypothetical protein ABFR89_06555 [Actinomycetota bacterium]
MSISLAEAVDGLYRDVVMEPERWGDEAYADWMESLGSDAEAIDREAARSLRRALRIAGKLERFWSSPDADRYRSEASWETRVDLAVGVPAWRPGLELAERELAKSPSSYAFDEVKRRFRVVNGAPWMEGVEFDEWIATGGVGGTG